MSKIDTRLSVDVKLQFPVEFNGATVNSVTIRRPKGIDNLLASKAKGNEIEKGMSLMARLCDQPVELFHELDEIDIEAIGDQYAAFTGRQVGADAN